MAVTDGTVNHQSKIKIINKIKLPSFISQAKWVPSLINQAVRVYLVNQTKNQRKAKSRADVKASTRKIYSQKGTGRARHGSVRAPIFVGGGKAHGPKGWLKRLTLPKKMKLKVLAMVLQRLFKEDKIMVIDQWPKLEKTKELENLLQGIVKEDISSLLLLYDFEKDAFLWRLGRNIAYLIVKPVHEVSFFELLKAQKVIVDQQALSKLMMRGRK